MVALGQAAQEAAFPLVQAFRSHYLTAAMDGSGKSFKAQMKYADKIKAKYVIILGDDELAKGQALVKTMATGDQESVSLDGLVDHMVGLLINQ